MQGTRYVLGTIGRGGTSGYGPNVHGSCIGERELLKSCDIVLDLRTQEWDDACTFSITGPMANAALPPNSMQGLSGKVEAYDSTPRDGKDPRIGNVSNVHYVSVDVYVRIALAFGATLVKGAVPV